MNWSDSMIEYLKRPLNLYSMPRRSDTHTIKEYTELVSTYDKLVTMHNHASKEISRRSKHLKKRIDDVSFEYYCRTGKFPNLTLIDNE